MEAISSGARITNLLKWLAHLQRVRPVTFLAVGALCALVGAALAVRLELRTRYDQLLPDNQASVTEFRRVMERVGTSTKVSVVLEAEAGATTKELRDFGDALVPRLTALGKPWVTDAADGTHAARAFLLPRAGLFANTDDLRALDEELRERWDWEVGKALDVNLEDEPAPVSYESLVKRFGLEQRHEQFPDGYYQSADGKALVVLVHTATPSGDLEKSRQAFERIRASVETARSELKAPAIRVSYAGDVVTSLAEYGAVHDDLMDVGLLGVSAVLAVVLAFFMRVRALLVLGFTVCCGMAVTFGATQLAIGHLNVATGFLFSIIAGNGINFGIIYMARYFEERRAGSDAEQSLFAAHERTTPSTLTVAVASAAAYGSLGASNFSVFRHFALIGSLGMLVCWLATVLLVPPALLLFDRARPFVRGSGSWWSRLRWYGARYDSLFGSLVSKAPRPIVVGGLTLSVLGALGLLPYLHSDPMEYDMRRMHSDLGRTSDIYRASELAARVLGGQLDNSMVVLAHRIDQVQALEESLRARRSAAPADQKPFEAVYSLLDFVPANQAEKLPILGSIRERLLRARRGISEADWSKIEPMLPPEGLAAYGLADLPEELARPFSEVDGTRGRVLLIEPTSGIPDTDLHYMIRWADSFRETRLPNGEVLLGSGRAVIFADMLRAVQRDIPLAIALSLGVTSLAVVLLFRNRTRALQVLGALLVGLAWMVLFMVGSRFKINFFNFVALPITFGIGVDYAVNLVRRIDSDPAEGVLGALRNTGGPIVLCSLTTTLGYAALLCSINQAIRGLGVLAVIGEVVCLLAALLVLPAALSLGTRRAPLPSEPKLTAELPSEPKASA
ncbi:MAG: MMPL family transporter [Polyangiaceae bacterium]